MFLKRYDVEKQAFKPGTQHHDLKLSLILKIWNINGFLKYLQHT